VSATSHGASAGVVLGIVAVLFGQQLGWLDLSDLLPTVEFLAIGIVVGGAFGAAVGYALGRRHLPKRPAPVEPWAAGTSSASGTGPSGAAGETPATGSPPSS
jgi:hypothetical protein